MKRIESVNDFVIKFANVNGTGSASANGLFAKAVFRMGVPVSPKNIFPSNIQGNGLPLRLNQPIPVPSPSLPPMIQSRLSISDSASARIHS